VRCNIQVKGCPFTTEEQIAPEPVYIEQVDEVTVLLKSSGANSQSCGENRVIGGCRQGHNPQPF
jgi:hypothetical protein